MIIRTDDISAAETAACKCAELIQTKNQKNRLDGLEVTVYGKDNEEWYHSEHYGSVLLPNASWRTVADEKADYYTWMARQQTDPKAEYLRSQAGTFSDTGADLRKVVHTLGEDFPEKSDDPVMFYYFKSSKGKEYYLCDLRGIRIIRRRAVPEYRDHMKKKRHHGGGAFFGGCFSAIILTT